MRREGEGSPVSRRDNHLSIPTSARSEIASHAIPIKPQATGSRQCPFLGGPLSCRGAGVLCCRCGGGDAGFCCCQVLNFCSWSFCCCAFLSCTGATGLASGCDHCCPPCCAMEPPLGCVFRVPGCALFSGSGVPCASHTRGCGFAWLLPPSVCPNERNPSCDCGCRVTGPGRPGASCRTNDCPIDDCSFKCPPACACLCSNYPGMAAGV